MPSFIYRIFLFFIWIIVFVGTIVNLHFVKRFFTNGISCCKLCELSSAPIVWIIRTNELASSRVSETLKSLLPIFPNLFSSRKMPFRSQVSSGEADAQCRPQVSRQMLSIHCHDWTCLFIAILECTWPAKRFPPKTVNEKKFFSTQ